jgi:hypothetical protein
MNDIDSEVDLISDSTYAHVDAGVDDALVSLAVRELCNRRGRTIQAFWPMIPS